MEINQQPPSTGEPVQTPPPSPNIPGSGPDHTLMGILAYLGILIIIPFVTEARHDPFVKFHLKQGLVLFIAEIIASVIMRVPVFGWILSPILGIGSLILVIIGIINVVNKQTKELPLIGHYASKINI